MRGFIPAFYDCSLLPTLRAAAKDFGVVTLRLRFLPKVKARAYRHMLAGHAKGDMLDAVLCLMQAAWAQGQGAPLYGLPPNTDPLEGWIVTA